MTKVISRLIDDAEEDVLSLSDIEEIKKGMDEIKRGKTLSEEILLREFGEEA